MPFQLPSICLRLYVADDSLYMYCTAINMLITCSCFFKCPLCLHPIFCETGRTVLRLPTTSPPASARRLSSALRSWTSWSPTSLPGSAARRTSEMFSSCSCLVRRTVLRLEIPFHHLYSCVRLVLWTKFCYCAFMMCRKYCSDQRCVANIVLSRDALQMSAMNL